MAVFAVRSVAAEAIARARAGGGPTLIEAMTYRYYGQYEGDTQTYKPPQEVADYRARDPLLRFRASTADRIEAAVRKVLQQGLRTPDIAQPGEAVVGTARMGDAVVAALQQG